MTNHKNPFIAPKEMPLTGATLKSAQFDFASTPFNMQALVTALFFVLACVLALGANNSWAQESSHTHPMPSKNTDCTGQDLKCAHALTPWLQKDGTLFLVWTAGGAVMFAQSKDMGRTLSPPIELARHDQFLDTGADARAQVVADQEGHVLVAYAFFKDKQWNSVINLVSSTDGGAHFSSPMPLIKNGASERFPSLGLDASGRVYVAYIDKSWVQLQRSKGLKQLGGSLAISSTSDWGQSFTPPLIINKESCECCRIGMAVSPLGGTVLAYRALFDKGVRDHAVQVIPPQKSQGGSSLEGIKEAHRVSIDGWRTDVCPHQGPSVAVSERATLHTVWFTQGQARQGLFYARSEDKGHHFSNPMAIGDVDKNESRPFILAQGQEVWMVWKRFDGEQSMVLMRHSKDDGLNWSPEQRVAQTKGYSDHPLLLQHAGAVYLSWLTRLEGFQLIELGSPS